MMQSKRVWHSVCRVMLALVAGFPISVAASEPEKPALVVVIAVDQLGSGVFEQHRSRFVGGLKRLASEGVVFPNAYQSHAATETCPGHSTILTGRHPAATGIVANAWYDRASGKSIYCVFDPGHPVPGREGQGRGPVNLKVSTLGEWLKAADPRARVFGVSGKDRSAIMMTGRGADGVYWWDDELGFNTSVAEKDDASAGRAPLDDFNTKMFAGWRVDPPDWRIADVRCLELAGRRTYGDLTLAHEIPPTGWDAGADTNLFATKARRHWFKASPLLDYVTLELAGSLIERHGLGKGEATDLLAISLSATDYIGHRYGNQGPEMCDNLAHLDHMLGEFLDKIDALDVPFVVVLTADHGSVDAAERVNERGIEAQRINTDALVREVGGAVQSSLALAANPIVGDGQQLFLVSRGDDPARRQRILEAVIAELDGRPEVEHVFPAAQIARTKLSGSRPADELTLAERYAQSYDPERSGDVIVTFKPNASLGYPDMAGDYISGHGSPWNYDRRVPIIFWWPGAQAFEQSLPVATVDIAPTLAAILGIQTPGVDGRCLDLDRGMGTVCR